jgi:hypothetical protein
MSAEPNRPQWVIFDKSETLAESVAAYVTTLICVVVCIMSSNVMGTGIWEIVSVLACAVWVLARCRNVLDVRITQLRTKAQAKAWADSLPEA